MVAWARRHQLPVLGSDSRGDAPADRFAWPRACILALGDERDGLAAPLRQACDDIVRLPTRGRISSLNVAMAGSMLLYAAMSG